MSLVTSIAPPVFGIAATVAVLSAEARRLPAQNLVALALISIGAAAALETCTTLARPFDLRTTIAATSLTTASLLASRPLARLPGPGPSHLFVRTVLAAVALANFASWPTGDDRFLVAAIRTAGIPIVLLLLAPWWINKRLAPATTPDWAGLAGPILLLGLATLELLGGSPAMAGLQTLAGAAMTCWAIRGLTLKPSGIPSSAAHSPTRPDRRSGS
jgi:hypothetical protein